MQVKQKTELSGSDHVVSSSLVADSSHHRGKVGLITKSERLVALNSDFVVFTNDTFGAEMNQNGLFTGSPLGIHDGTDSVLWTAQDVIGTTLVADSTAQANSGTKSVLVSRPSLNDVWEFDNGSDQSLASHVAISMFIYVDSSWSTDSIQIYGWDGTSSEVGTRVNLEDYFDPSNFGVWQQIAIPLADMNLASSTIQSFRMELVTKTGQSPLIYFDDMQLEAAGLPIVFTAAAPKLDRPYHVFQMIITLVDNVTGVVTNGTMPGLAYNALLGVSSLTNGVLLSRKEFGDSVFVLTLQNLGDFLSFGTEVKSVISDGTNTQIVLQLDFPEPLILQGPEENNRITLSIRDDLRGLIQFTAALRGASDTVVNDDTGILEPAVLTPGVTSRGM